MDMDFMVKTVQAAERLRDQETEVLGPDGLLHCANCGGHRQCFVPYFNITVFCQCDCQKENHEDYEAAQTRRDQQEKIKEYRSLGFPEKLTREFRFENDDRRNPKLSDAMMRYCDHFDELRRDGVGLLLFGPSGAGKSFFAGCICNELIDRGHPCLMTSILWLTQDFKTRINDLPRFSAVCLDDFGVERDTSFMTEKVYFIIDVLYRNKVPMIITTNMDTKTMGEVTDPAKRRIIDRLLEACHPVQVNGDSRRKDIGKTRYKQINQMLGIGSERR